MDGNSILRHPFIVRFEANELHKEEIKKNNLEHAKLRERIDNMILALNGEDGWMLTPRKKDAENDAC